MYQFKLTDSILIQISEDIYAVVNKKSVNLAYYIYLININMFIRYIYIYIYINIYLIYILCINFN